MFTDEEQPTPHRCDLLINDHPESGTFGSAYREAGLTGSMLLGGKYFLIDTDHEIVAPRDSGLFVSVGGGDQMGLLSRFREVFIALSKEMPTQLVVGPISPSELQDFKGMDVHRTLTPKRFASGMARARLAVTASGNTLFERIFHGTPGISVAQSPHQETMGRAFEAQGVTRHLGLGESVSPSRLFDEVFALSKDDAMLAAQTAAAKEIDIIGGCKSIVRCIEELRT